MFFSRSTNSTTTTTTTTTNPPHNNDDVKTNSPDAEAIHDDDDDDGTTPDPEERLRAIEAQAIDQIKAEADAAFRPTPSVWESNEAQPLLAQVDGPSLTGYDGNECVYVGRSLLVPAGGNLAVPIAVTIPGSVVEYIVEVDQYDISFGIVVERDDEIVIAKEESRLTALESPLQQKFLVGKVPCLLRFQWDNGYSWLREKLVSYKVSVRPPTRDSIRLSRRRRAQACLEDVRKEWTELTNELVPAIQATTTSLQEQMTELWKQYTEIKQQYEEAKQEQERLLGRKQVREEQERLLKQRLEQGWDDENAQPDHRANGK